MLTNSHIKNKPPVHPSFGNQMNNTSGAFLFMEQQLALNIALDLLEKNNAFKDGQEEIWKDVLGYEGLYLASNYGRVKNSRTGRMLKQFHRSGGYYAVALYKNGVGKLTNVQRIILPAFKGKSDLPIDHISGIKSNNRLDNLEYVSHRENMTRVFLRSKTSSVFTGVCWHKRKSKWQSRITIDKKVIQLGYFNSEIDASNAYQNRLKQYYETGN